MRNLFLLLVLLLHGPMPARAAEATSFDYLQAISPSAYHRLESAAPPAVYHLFVRLPAEYAEAPDTRYPTVYLLDGGNMFPLLAGYYRYLELGEEIIPSILVGISYGSDYYREGNQRSRDFTAAAADRDFWGGAGAFQALLRERIIPLVEKRYRSDPARRIVFGQSLGGQFVLYTALTKPSLFHGHIAVNPALHRNLAFFLGLDPAGQQRPDPVRPRLFVASGADDLPRFREPALQWIDQWTERADRPWAFRAETLPGESHFSAAPAGFRRGMRWILPVGPAER